MSDGDHNIQEWEVSLPAPGELIPLSQTLIPPVLASVFKLVYDPSSTSNSEAQLVPEKRDAAQARCSPCFDEGVAPPVLSLHENHRVPAVASFPFLPETASIDCSPPLNFLGCGLSSHSFNIEVNLWGNGADQQHKIHSFGCEDVNGAASYPLLHRKGGNDYGSNVGGATNSCEGGSEKRFRKRLELDFEDVDSSTGLENPNKEGPTARTLKRPRLVWTPQLHKRFVEAVSHLGIKNAVPKTIMQLMNVEGLTRENVASHLQKYRLYLKRKQGGLSSEGGSSVSDQLFASTPVPPGLVTPAQFHTTYAENFIPRVVPMPMATMGGPIHMVCAPSGLTPSFSHVENNLYNNVIRFSSSQRFPAEDQELRIDRTSSKQALTLFPTNET